MLQIQNLYKNYGSFTALNGLNLDIQEGELFGFVGPNGAGKTTTMKILAGLLRPDEGEVFLNGFDIRKEGKKIKEQIGYMPDFFGVYDNLKVVEYMEFYASIYGIEGAKAKARIYELLKLVHLKEEAEKYVDELSRGMKQKLCLARCLIHNPQLLILDEPASGLDPSARLEMKEILRTLHEAGQTIIISSHILPELSKLCSTIGIIQHGTMVLKGTVEEILQQMNTSNPLMIRVMEGEENIVSILKENPFVENISIQGKEYLVRFKGGKKEEADLLQVLIGNNIKISSYCRQEGSLESLFIQLMKEKEEEAVEI